VDEGERRAAAEAAELVTLPAGSAALVEDGEPTKGMYLVYTGAMDLIHEDQVVDTLEPGECFGHPSLLSGLAPAFSVIAREDSTALFIPREPALRVLGHPAGAAFIASSLRERLVRTGETAHALPDLSLMRLSALVDREPLILEPQASLREAARAMTEESRPAALVRLDDEMGMVTDADLREHVLAEGRSPEDPVTTVTQTEPLRAPGDHTVGEVLIDLLEAHRRDLCVTDRNGRIVGILGIEDLTGGEHSSFALRRELAEAPDLEALVTTVEEELPRLLTSLLSAGLAPLEITRVLAAQSDVLTMRLLDFAFQRHGQAPLAWAWMALGSVARRELTLASDQDNALAYSDDADQEADAFFERVATDVNDGLSRCGFGEDNAEVLARSPRWRMSAGQWRDELQACLEHPDRSHLVRAAVTFDFRHVGGGLEIVPELVEVLRSAREYPDFLGRLARTVTDWPVPLKRRGRFETDDQGRIDLKKGGALPVANLARFYAISSGITTSGTLPRLVAAEDTGHLAAAEATNLREAFSLVARIRLEHHAACLRDGLPLDNLVAPDTLPALQRASLREALEEVAEQQKKMSAYAPMGV
jgi:CBS domain-containing protein